MSFNVLAIRSGLDTGDDALHPVLSDASSPDIIDFDAYDGPNVMRVVATALCVIRVRDGGLKTLARLRDVKIDIYTTDGRLALACVKYDKGGGWVGFGTGALVAVTANAVSKARAARRSRGKVLVGHIRYPWLKSVGASSKLGFTSSEAIRLEYSEMLSDGPVRSLLELTLPKNIDATLVAGEIARRAASYRLAYYPEMKAEVRTGLPIFARRRPGCTRRRRNSPSASCQATSTSAPRLRFPRCAPPLTVAPQSSRLPNWPDPPRRRPSAPNAVCATSQGTTSARSAVPRLLVSAVTRGSTSPSY